MCAGAHLKGATGFVIPMTPILITSNSSYFQSNGILFQIMAMLFEDIGFQESHWEKNSVVSDKKLIAFSFRTGFFDGECRSRNHDAVYFAC